MLPSVVDGGVVVVTSVTVVPAEVTTVVVFVMVVDPEGDTVVFVTSVVSSVPTVVVGAVGDGVVDVSPENITNKTDCHLYYFSLLLPHIGMFGGF